MAEAAKLRHDRVGGFRGAVDWERETAGQDAGGLERQASGKAPRAFARVLANQEGAAG